MPKKKKSSGKKKTEKKEAVDSTKFKSEEIINVVGMDYELIEKYEAKNDESAGNHSNGGWKAKRVYDGEIFYLPHRMVNNWIHIPTEEED